MSSVSSYKFIRISREVGSLVDGDCDHGFPSGSTRLRRDLDDSTYSWRLTVILESVNILSTTHTVSGHENLEDCSYEPCFNRRNNFDNAIPYAGNIERHPQDMLRLEKAQCNWCDPEDVNEQSARIGDAM
ncbi:hypothetical protein KIN20_025018 [Parelaphostrongylus tenuis]|uniref:Uncharacterized protein n=1 Tax=Parelaphostrongylus tenuis TaxID=148309 RepID=A0AAD5N892_PARTN|nr:hypothetical protein KIN20_025018 [Parelaphostrongylus tenuis]